MAVAEPEPLRIHAVGYVALTVSDRDRSLAWYTEVLGFQEEFRQDTGNRRVSVLRFGTGGYSVGLVERTPDGDDGFDDRYTQLDLTFGGAGRLTGDLTPECAAALQAVLESLGKKRGREDTRTAGQRFHDALQEACELLIGAKMVPDRAGTDTHVDVHVGLRDLLDLPVLCLRGEQSTLLTADTAQAMRERGPRAAVALIPDCGHAPALNTPEQIGLIERFLQADQTP